MAGVAVAATLIVADILGRGIQLRDNVYGSAAEPGEWFRVGDAPAGFEAWVARSGEQGARREKVAFPDPSRCIATYMKQQGKEASIDAFIAEVRRQSRGNWRAEFSAAAVNQWIREGFGTKKVAASQCRVGGGQDGRMMQPKNGMHTLRGCAYADGTTTGQTRPTIRTFPVRRLA